MKENEKILAGFCRKDITPAGAVPMAGFGDNLRRLSEGVLDPICGTCVALTDEDGETALLFSVDFIYATTKMTQGLRERVCKLTGVPEDHIMLCATHTHSGPSVSNTEQISVQHYNDFVEAMLTEAAIAALADRAPAQVYVGRGYTEKLNFVRHYKLSDGTYGGDNFGNFKDNPVVDHASPVDNEMQLIRLARAGKPDILLMNWQGHAKMSGTADTPFGRQYRKWLSADYIGYIRKHLEAATGGNVIYFTGASGNVNVHSYIREETPVYTPDSMGMLLSKCAQQVLQDMKPVQAGKLSFRRRLPQFPVDHSDDPLLDKAKEVWAMWEKDIPACKRLARQEGFNSAYTCMHIISRSKQQESRPMELNTIALGDIAFATAPYEMFCTNGEAIKDGSPFEMTFICTCSNASHNYLASDFAFTHGCYEVDSRLYARGTAEKLVEHYLEMLKEQKEGK